MEIGLGDMKALWAMLEVNYSLNPCFSGNRFGRFRTTTVIDALISLNPCFSGNRFGRVRTRNGFVRQPSVLILVLVEIGLGATFER